MLRISKNKNIHIIHLHLFINFHIPLYIQHILHIYHICSTTHVKLHILYYILHLTSQTPRLIYTKHKFPHVYTYSYTYTYNNMILRVLYQTYYNIAPGIANCTSRKKLGSCTTCIGQYLRTISGSQTSAVHTCTHTQTSTTHIYTYTYIYIYIFIYVHIYIYIHIYIIHISVYLHIYMCIYPYMYTHTHFLASADPNPH